MIWLCKELITVIIYNNNKNLNYNLFNIRFFLWLFSCDLRYKYTPNKTYNKNKSTSVTHIVSFVSSTKLKTIK